MDLARWPGSESPADLADEQADEQAADGGADDVPVWAARALEQLLTVTYWLDPGEAGDPFTATIRFTGHRTDAAGASGAGDSFSQEETVEGIVPGSGPVAVTAAIAAIALIAGVALVRRVIRFR